MRRRLLVVAAIVLVLVAVGGATVAWSVRRAAAAGALGESQWSKLRAGLERNLAAPVEAAEPSGPEAPVETDAQVPPPAGREPLDPAILARQEEEYRAGRPKSVVELQQFRRTDSSVTTDPDGVQATVTLTNLNPEVNIWYLLTTRRSDGRQTALHLANADPAAQELALDPARPEALTIVRSGRRTPCELRSERVARILAEAARVRTPYVQVCDGAIIVRLSTSGHRTAKEWATDFLRDNVPGGEKLTVFVRSTIFRDAYLDTAELERPPASAGGEAAVELPRAPAPARIDARQAGKRIEPGELGLPLDDGIRGALEVGAWVPVRDSPGVFVSVLQAGLVAAEILAGNRATVGALDEVESRASVFLVAFDLELYDLGFALGTDHPRVGWSERPPEAVRDPALPGPDGIGDIAPLVSTGVVAAADAQRAVATFTGGFKRSHGAFRSGPLAQVRNGSHYGFIEQGVVLSKLVPGLSTLFVREDGRVEMKTWSEADDAGLRSVRFARQNGVPLVELDPSTGVPRPGAMVSNWGAGNWSGSQDQKLRTLRAGACLQESDRARFLIYAYFSGATPSAMTRVFQAYDCSHAMLLDMNALEHTYLALYRVGPGGLEVHHLVRGMNVLDKTVDGKVLPRFLGFADNRDFFYVLRKER